MFTPYKSILEKNRSCLHLHDSLSRYKMALKRGEFEREREREVYSESHE